MAYNINAGSLISFLDTQTVATSPITPAPIKFFSGTATTPEGALSNAFSAMNTFNGVVGNNCNYAAFDIQMVAGSTTNHYCVLGCRDIKNS